MEHPVTSRWCRSPLATSAWLLLHGVLQMLMPSLAPWEALLGRRLAVVSAGVLIPMRGEDVVYLVWT